MSDASGEVVKLLRTLVSLKSPSGREEKVREFIIDYLKKAGYSIEVDEVGNVVVDCGGKLWVTAHMDTVDLDFPFRYENGVCYGTGVADDKASLAAMLLASKELENKNLNFAFFVDEEETGLGSQHFAETRRPGIAVVMEPTELKICKEHWGVLEVLVSVFGKASHASMPECGVNAIERAIEVVERLRKFEGDARFNLLSLHSYPENVYSVPDRCDVKFEYLIPHGVKLPVLQILEICEEYGGVEVLELANPFVSEEVTELLVEAVKLSGIEAESSHMPSWTDAVNLKEAGWDVVVFGPGSLSSSHTALEYVSVEEVVKAVEVLKNLSRVITSRKN